MLSNGSTFTDFNRLHGPEGVRPPRDDIDNCRAWVVLEVATMTLEVEARLNV
jgi:hypothetical protein